MKKKALTAHGLILVLIMTFLTSHALAQEEIIILHTNDLHGESLARIGSIVAELRKAHPDLLLVDGGDLFSGTPVSNLFQGQAEQTSIFTLGFDALALGNHDFDFGRDTLERSLEAGVPWLAANIFKEDGTTLAPPFLIKEVGQVRVLLVGLCTPSTTRMSFPRNVEGLSFADPTSILKQVLHEQQDAYDLCVVLSHLGYGEDLLLAQRVPGITAIVGGHSHTTLSKPVRIKDTIITQAGSSSKYLGKITISIEEGYPARGELLPIDEKTPVHPTIAYIDDYYEAVLAAEMDQVIGHAPRAYVKNSVGLLLNEALLHFSGADAALYNSGGVRTGLPQGAVTKRDVFAVEPFGNQAVLVTLSGPDFAELLKAKASRSSDFYHGPRLIDLDRSYTVVTSDFLTSEGSSYPMLAQEEILYLGSTVREVLQDYLRDHFLEQIKEGAQ